jgi:hypothetical protein
VLNEVAHVIPPVAGVHDVFRNETPDL